MKKKEIQSLKGASPEELRRKLVDLQTSYRSAKFAVIEGKEKRVRLPGEIKKDIARVMTFLNDRAREGVSGLNQEQKS